MEQKINELEVNGIIYVPKDSVKQSAQELEGMPYCIVRTYSAGVFAGYIKTRNGAEVELIEARRLWYWSGASSLSQLAMEGVKNPNSCKFPCLVDRVVLLNVIEILDCTEQARKCIAEVPIWEQ